ncbi:MAG: hypothetical protein EBV32_00285 [Proteobacteria bacterium]|uniref:Uncharacterized protein n=1 Tax=Candidatus Fonsibacter lacus TaxID=2576439 RepID=A0A964UXC8_9PROT|nr:hypothetical protein [Candidatus Fonsibacter lacus]
MTEPLSPAAQAVYDAYCEWADDPYYYERSGMVAALRAAAEQISSRDGAQQLLAIAAELEAANG